jgi:capsular polysaccharide transport system permease protein
MFQNQHKMIDPSADMAIKNEIIGNLEASIVQKTAEYNQLISYMSRDTIDAMQLEMQITELKAALNKTKAELSGSDATRLNDLMFNYQKLKSDVDFATEVYKKTLVECEVLRIEAVQESKIFEVVAMPTLPDGYVYPRRLRMTLTTIVLILVGYKIVMLIGAVVKDHRD